MATTKSHFVNIARSLLKGEFVDFLVNGDIFVTSGFSYQSQTGNQADANVDFYTWDDTIELTDGQNQRYSKTVLMALCLYEDFVPGDANANQDFVLSLSADNSTIHLTGSASSHRYKVLSVKIDPAKATVMFTLDY